MDKIAVVILLVSLSMVAQGVGEISINKILSKETITDNDIVTVKIILVNNMDKAINGTLFDSFPAIAAPEGNFTRNIYSADPVLRWDITLKPSETKEITYKLNFTLIPAPLKNRNYTLQSASFEVEGDIYESKRPVVYFTGVIKEPCNYNGVCDPGENYGNCFQDCFSGGRDDYCDRKDDLICDPDCAEGADPDCELGTTTVRVTTVPTTIPTTVPTTTIEHEESGGLSGYLPYLVGVIVLIVIAVVVLRSNRLGRMDQKKKEEKEKLRIWAEEQLRNGEDPELLKKALEKQGADPSMVDEVMKRL